MDMGSLLGNTDPYVHCSGPPYGQGMEKQMEQNLKALG